MADRYLVTYQGRRGSILRRGLTRSQAEQAAHEASRALRDTSDHVEIVKDEGFVTQDNAIYQRYKRGGS